MLGLKKPKPIPNPIPPRSRLNASNNVCLHLPFNGLKWGTKAILNRTRIKKGQRLALCVLERKALVGSIMSISKDLDISPRQIRKTLDQIKIQQGLLSDFVGHRVPLALAESTTLGASSMNMNEHRGWS